MNTLDDIRLRVAAVSLIGGRKEQQDSYYMGRHRSGALYYVLADGMGGHSGGKEASNIIKQCAENCISTADDNHDAQALFQEILEQSWKHMRQVYEERNLSMFSTVVMACVHSDGSMTWAHVGDSRLYVLDQLGDTIFRTLDHSLTELAVRSGELTEEEAKNSPDRSTLYRSVGGEKPPKAVFGHRKDLLIDGSLLLLCSDGFWEFAPISEIPKKIQQGLSLQETLQQASNLAIEIAGADADNTTVLGYLHMQAI